MSPTVVVRLADEADAAAVLALKKLVFAESDRMLWEPGEYLDTVPDEAARLRRLGASATSGFLVASIGPELVGFCSLVGATVNRLRHAASLALGVRQAHWGQGVGRRLLQATVAHADRAGITRLELTVHTTHLRAMRLYLQAGFEVEGRRRRSLRVGGQYVDEYLMSRLADPAGPAAPAGQPAGRAAPVGAGIIGSMSPAATPARRPPLPAVHLRPAEPADALCLSVLAMQVFLDTYATQGIRPAIAREVLSAYGQGAFEAALASDHSRLAVAELQGHLVGFAQLSLGATHALAPAGVQAELLRLYVQEPFTGARVGTQLLAWAEHAAAGQGATVLWLTPWVHNARARAFYARRGYTDHGLTWFTFEGESHENRLLAKPLVPADDPRRASAA